MHKVLQKLWFGIMLLASVSAFTGCAGKEDTFLLVDATDDSSAYSQEDCTQESGTTRQDSEENMDSGSLEEDLHEQICVFVCGQVVCPDVYYLESDARICDALEAAGGCLETADICAVNQAEKLLDGSMVYIPAIGEDYSKIVMNSVETDGLVHLNQATKEELMTLPGIGESKADAIIEYRSIHGGFATEEELMNIPGIKEGVFQKIQEYITVK